MMFLNNAVNMAEAGGISRTQIERVLMVGGTTLIPAVQRGIRGIFGREKVQCHKPFEAVAHGALAFHWGLISSILFSIPMPFAIWTPHQGAAVQNHLQGGRVNTPAKKPVTLPCPPRSGKPKGDRTYDGGDRA